MQLILREDVDNLGRTGQVVNVRDGYGRNYLIPRGLAVPASDRSLKQLEHQKRMIEARDRKLRKDAEAYKVQLEKTSVNIAKPVGEEDRLFGSVTTREIAEALEAAGVNVDKKKIELDQPIRTIGVHTAKVRLSRDMVAEVKVWVVAK
ncbi:MAG: 50S ribosomal protein L9 [Deltaproteobacteria bacterium]|nr:50S ribosomal protein L9 [Deltaproteobacteria bacterium]